MNTPTLRALALFDEYLTLPVARRATALASLQDEDPDTHRMLQRLLASDMALDAGEQADLLDQVTETLVAPTRSSASARDPLLGQRLGPWRIERVIGLGGMGTVYEAQRDDGQYRQRVALKCIHRELSSPPLVASFLRERETLAALDHPGIAGLIDGGLDPLAEREEAVGPVLDRWATDDDFWIRRSALLANLISVVLMISEIITARR